MTAPTTRHARFTLLRFTFALSIITYIDRVCISSAGPRIQSDLGLTKTEMGWVFGAFSLAYAVFEIPSGWLGDRIGPKKVLTRIVLWWSAFTMASGAAWSYASLLVTRFLFGAGEAGAFPNMSRSLTRWFPVAERGTAHGAMFMGSRLGAAFTPLMVAQIIEVAGWRSSFWIFGSFGVVWCLFWTRWFRDDPAKHPEVSAEELAIIRGGATPQAARAVDWNRLMDSNLVWICMMYFCYGYSLYFYLTWLPTYLREARAFSDREVSVVHTIILLTAAGANILGGKLTDYLVKRYGLQTGRRIGALGMPLSGLALAGAALTESSMVSAVLLAVAAGAGDLCLSACWSICHDVGGEAAGTLSGFMNTFGNLGGTLSPIALGYAVDGLHSWAIPLVIASAVSVAGGALTLMIDPRRSYASG